MKIIIETIPHSKQRYNTCGDWQWNEDVNELTIKVSETNLFDYQMLALVGVHELLEAILCRHEYIPEWQVDHFDENWKPQDGLTEPGDHPAAPYHRQHLFASNIERLVAARLGVNWQQYEKEIERLG